MGKTLAEDLREEAEQLRRRFVHHTRPKRPLTMNEARALCEAMDKTRAGHLRQHGKKQ